ncbi:4549_t:CDS:2 [Ambispora leptoticha]|uniref:4549_t:CDS:1 n=1 Tax=Ambispora leptoticha TaxID=144679 RepID=A0A9N9GKI9_9GLOM|nr:4549_t:CDS:2 [Ambispora leptoticha]
MDEIEIWNLIIKWGIINTPTLGKQHVSKWTPQNFTALEKTLHPCIPLIRYSSISSDDYLKKYENGNFGLDLKNSAPPQPVKILPPRSSSIGSKIIDSNHAKLISAWNDKKDSADFSDNFCRSSYEFKLLYRGSRDGFNASKFRELCGSETQTVVVVKTNQIGGIFVAITLAI